MKTVIRHDLPAASVRTYKSYRNLIEVTMTETVGDVETHVQADLSYEEAQTLYKSLRNSLIEAKVLRGKKQY